MATLPLQGLLEEINRQSGLIHNGPDSPSSQNTEAGSVKELFHDDNEYRLTLSRVKERLIELLKMPIAEQGMEASRAVEPNSWKILACCEPYSRFIEPESMKQRCQALQNLRAGRKGSNSSRSDRGNAIWKDPNLLEWASKDESSLIVFQSSFGTLELTEAVAIELIEYLEAQDQKVAWILNAVPRESQAQAPQKWNSQSALKQIAAHILCQNAPLNVLKRLALVVESYKRTSSQTDWFNSLIFALEEISIMYIVVDMRVFGANSTETSSWPAAYGELFQKLKAKSPQTRLKVMLLNCHPFPEGSVNCPVLRIAPLTAARAGLRNSARQADEGRRKPKIQLNLLKRTAESQDPEPASCQAQLTVNQNTTPSTPVVAKRWKRCRIKRPRDWFDEMEGFEASVDASRKDPDESCPCVKIAILDTGVDISHPDISREYKSGRIKYHDFTNESNDIEDLDGHGTHSVSLIAKFAPNAEIYAGRVFRQSVAAEGNAEIVAKAIAHATTVWKVDIISLSLGFTEDDENLRDEIRKSCANSIIMFAAAANNTTNEIIPIRFPARMKEVICVFSSDAYGRPSVFNPPTRSDRANFTFPGEKIEGAWPSHVPAEGIFEREGTTYKLQDGTSCATPIAAAVAAGILEFAWQEREHKIRRVKLLKHYSGMTDVLLKRMVDQHRSGDNVYHYVKPWKLISISRMKEEIPIYISDTLDHVDY